MCAAREMKRLSQLESLRDEIVANYEERNSIPAIGAMCKNDIDLLKTWSWDRYLIYDNLNLIRVSYSILQY